VPSKVLIIGAGPSGTACAATLHRLGHEVVVVDKATFPRDKCCGDGLTTNALRILEGLNFDPSRVADWQTCSDVEMRSFSGRKIDLPLPSIGGQFAAIAPRAQFDHALVEHCRDMGITIHEGCAFESITHHDTNGISVQVENLGELTVDYVVAADGMWSPVRKSLGLSTPGYLGEWHAFRQYIGNVHGSANEKLHIWFDKDLLPGYAWSFPLPDNRVNFGFGILRTSDRSTKYMNDLWRDLLTRPHITAVLGEHFVPEDRHTAWPIPARIHDAVRSSGRVLFIGDAVCATDTLTGEGIGQALETGIAAGEAIHECDTAADVRDSYSHKIDSLLLADHRMSSVLSRMLTYPVVARMVLALVDTNNWTRKNFVRWMFEDEARAVVFTPRRWHRRFLARPGAYSAK
jgi:geranylgeranyl reductase family protein